MATNISSQLSSDNIVPDILTSASDLPLTLTVKWPSVTLDTPGKELDREATQPEPTIHVSPVPEDNNKFYTLIMTDPDLMATNDQSFGQVRHWLAINTKISPSGSLSIPDSSTISPYIGPAPLPNYITPRPHRYIFILASPTSTTASGITVETADLQKLQAQYSAAFEGSQGLQDLKDRWGFNAQRFLEAKGLKVEGVTWMKVGGTVKSAVDNVVMTAQAGVNKVLGR